MRVVLRDFRSTDRMEGTYENSFEQRKPGKLEEFSMLHVSEKIFQKLRKSGA